MGNKKKSEQLGMPHGTACNKLRKNVLFDLLKYYRINECYRCGKIIGHVDELSMEHKRPWLDSENPKKLFWDLDNIAFSHTTCNYGARRTPDDLSHFAGCNKKEVPEGYAWCCGCGAQPREAFSKNSTNTRSGLEYYCKSCRRVIR